MKKILYVILGIAIIVAAVLISQHWVSTKPEPRKNNKQHNITYIKAQQVSMTEQTSTVSYPGLVTSFDVVSLASEVSGRLLQADVRFKAGESFRKGENLINIYSEDIEASMKASKSSFLQVLSSILPDLKVDYADEYDKWYSFFTSIDIEKTLPELPTMNSEKEKIFLSTNNVLTTYYNLKQQEINLTRYKISAPFNGSFKSVSKEIGAVTSMGTELATIIRSDKLEIVVPVFVEDAQWIHVGDEVKVTSSTGHKMDAKVSRISNYLENQSVNVYLTFNVSKDKKLLEGEYIDAVFESKPIDAFKIVREAIVDHEYVYYIENGKLNTMKVDVERVLSDDILISNVDSTKMIVTESVSAISENTEYKARD